MPDAPITPDERAAMRERYTADLPSAWDTSAAAHARALRDLGTSARNDVPRLLDALATAEAEVKRLRADVARLTARPAPAWDEEAVQAEVLGIDARHHFHGTACLCGFDSHGRARSATEHITSAVLAVVRDHLPVKPSREAVIEAMLGSDIITDDLRAEASATGTTQREPFLCFADAVLDLFGDSDG